MIRENQELHIIKK